MTRTRARDAVFQAISHPARRAILRELRAGERPAGALAAPFGISFAAVSQHLKILKEAKLISERRDGRNRIYVLHPERLQDVWEWADQFAAFWNSKLDALGRHLDRRSRE